MCQPLRTYCVEVSMAPTVWVWGKAVWFGGKHTKTNLGHFGYFRKLSNVQYSGSLFWVPFDCRVYVKCTTESVRLGSAVEFHLCCRLTLVFSWAKIRTLNAFLRRGRGRKQAGGRGRQEKQRCNRSRKKRNPSEGHGFKYRHTARRDQDTTSTSLCLWSNLHKHGTNKWYSMANTPMWTINTASQYLGLPLWSIYLIVKKNFSQHCLFIVVVRLNKVKAKCFPLLTELWLGINTNPVLPYIFTVFLHGKIKVELKWLYKFPKQPIALFSGATLSFTHPWFSHLKLVNSITGLYHAAFVNATLYECEDESVAGKMHHSTVKQKKRHYTEVFHFSSVADRGWSLCCECAYTPDSCWSQMTGRV